jgi:hypothetical protein
MMSDSRQGQWEEREAYVPGALDLGPAEASRGRSGGLSYRLLASRAHRYSVCPIFSIHS